MILSKSIFTAGAICVALAQMLCAGELEFTRSDAKIAYEMADALVRKHPERLSGTKSALKAAMWINIHAGAMAELDRFSDYIYDEEHQFANVLLEVRSQNPMAPWVILISHFDTPPNMDKGFVGANDGASTSGLLIALARALRRADNLKQNVLLAWTDAEECRIAYMPRDGFQGSKRLVKYVKKKGLNVRAAICLDMLGDKDLNIEIPLNGTSELRQLAKKAATLAGMRDKLILKNTVTVKDDHVPFIEAGYPALDIIDFDYGSARGKNDYWHTSQDTMDKISEESLFLSGKLVCELLKLLN